MKKGSNNEGKILLYEKNEQKIRAIINPETEKAREKTEKQTDKGGNKALRVYSKLLREGIITWKEKTENCRRQYE